jgi:hypothetical protein
MSLLDTDEVIKDEGKFKNKMLVNSDSTIKFNIPAYHELILAELDVESEASLSGSDRWIKVNSSIQIDLGISCGYLYSDIIVPDSTKQLTLRLFSPLSESQSLNGYAGYISIPNEFQDFKIRVYIKSCRDFSGKIEKVQIQHFWN